MKEIQLRLIRTLKEDDTFERSHPFVIESLRLFESFEYHQILRFDAVEILLRLSLTKHRNHTYVIWRASVVGCRYYYMRYVRGQHLTLTERGEIDVLIINGDDDDDNDDDDDGGDDG